MELAEFSTEAERSVGAAAEIAKKAAQDRAELERKAVQSFLNNAKRAAAELEAAGQAGEAGELMETAQAQAQAKLERIKTDEIKTQLDAVEKATELRMQALDIEKDTVETARDIAETFDGSAAAIAPLLEQGLAIERNRLSELRRQAAESRKLTGDSLKTRKLELDVVKQEASVRKQEYEDVKRIAELRREEVAVIEEGLEDEMSFLSDIGANWRRILDIQGDLVGLARERYQIAQDELEAARASGATGLELLRKETEARKAWFSLQKKSVGVQKDIFEKIIGKAFGEIRGGVGAIRGRTEAAAKFGIERTRVVTAAGMFAKAGPGGVKTIEQRAIERQLGGKFGFGAAPKKLSAEKKLENAVRGTTKATDKVATNTANTATSSKTTADTLTTPGSAFVHDSGAHGLLASILSVAKEIAIGVMGAEKTIGAGTGDIRARLESAIASAVSEQKQKSDKLQKSLDKVKDSTKKTAESTAETAQKAKEVPAAARARAARLAENTNPLAGPVGGEMQTVLAGAAEKSAKAFVDPATQFKEALDNASKTTIEWAHRQTQSANATAEARKKALNEQLDAEKKKISEEYKGSMILQDELEGVEKKRAAGMQKIDFDRQKVAKKVENRILEENETRKKSTNVFARLEAQKAKLGGGLKGPSGITRIGETPAGVIGIGTARPGVRAMGGGRALGGGAAAAAGATMPRTAAETAAMADSMTGLTPGSREAAATAARPGVAAIGGAGTAAVGEAASIPSLQITGTLRVSFESKTANMVAEVINTTEVVKAMEKAGWLKS